MMLYRLGGGLEDGLFSSFFFARRFFFFVRRWAIRDGVLIMHETM
jgi:hypothetical protein